MKIKHFYLMVNICPLPGSACGVGPEIALHTGLSTEFVDKTSGRFAPIDALIPRPPHPWLRGRYMAASAS
jgi:hypothetical protein